MIVVSGLIADEPIQLVLRGLLATECKFILIEDNRFPGDVRIEHRLGSDGKVTGFIAKDGGFSSDLDELTGIYIRYSSFKSKEPFNEFSGWEADLVKAECSAFRSFVFDSLDCAVVNRLNSGMSNCCKPLQSMIGARYGFRIPDAIVTNDPTTAAEFIRERDRRVVFKGIGGTRTIVGIVQSEDIERLPRLASCPVMFQAYVQGVNVRVHVVKDRVFSTRIYSDEVDYRYAPTRFEPISLPAAIEEACIKLTHDLELLFSGIDLIENEEGYWFLEANPSPGFSFFEINAGLPISTALVELLRCGS
jgi:glutathione synthase/RimK-type ligase-like ATP-grasp enzyme